MELSCQGHYRDGKQVSSFNVRLRGTLVLINPAVQGKQITITGDTKIVVLPPYYWLNSRITDENRITHCESSMKYQDGYIVIMATLFSCSRIITNILRKRVR